MVDNLNLTTLISQIPEAQKIHHTQLAHPEAQQAIAQEMVLRRQRQEKIKSPKVTQVPSKPRWIRKDTNSLGQDGTFGRTTKAASRIRTRHRSGTPD